MFEHRLLQTHFEIATSAQLLFALKQARQLRAITGTSPDYFSLRTTSELLTIDLLAWFKHHGESCNTLENMRNAIVEVKRNDSLEHLDRAIRIANELCDFFESEVEEMEAAA